MSVLTTPSEGSSPSLVLLSLVGLVDLESSSDACVSKKLSRDTSEPPSELLDDCAIFRAWILHQRGYSLLSGLGQLSVRGGGHPPVEGDIVDMIAFVANSSFGLEVALSLLIMQGEGGSPEAAQRIRTAPCTQQRRGECRRAQERKEKQKKTVQIEGRVVVKGQVCAPCGSGLWPCPWALVLDCPSP
jgi:hypothetical protein